MKDECKLKWIEKSLVYMLLARLQAHNMLKIIQCFYSKDVRKLYPNYVISLIVAYQIFGYRLYVIHVS